ncbi:MAG: serine/threonine protein kinase [Burkholderiaceae bacterium]|nr:serine/threonine protein kinase [Burkholderiaceae bacterium]
MAADWLARAGVLARRHPAAIAAALALVTSLGAWVYSGVRSALVDLAAANLHWLADSESMAVRTWIGEKQLNVVRWARDPRVSQVAEQLLAAAHRGEDALRQACTGAAGARLVQLIDALRLEEAAAAIHLIDRDGRVLAARDTGKCAMQVAPALRAAFEPALQGRPQFAASRFEAERIGVLVPADAPKIWISAPVRDGAGEVIAALDIGKPADERFARLFAAAGIGATGESYAFDGRGMLLTESRLREALVERGALRPGESAVLRQRLDAPQADGEPQPIRLVAQALAGLDASPPRLQGELLQPYTTYHGERVVGAWRWLEPHGFGIAVEVSEAEAFAPLRRIELAFLGLGALVGAVAFGFLVALLRMQRMAEEVAEAQRVGNYELLEQVGQGGMARVYRAQHRLLKRPTAVKIIDLAMTSDELLARFDREVRLASQLMHPNTVEVFDYGRTPEGQPFYAMEFLDGLTLQEVVDQHGPLPPARAAHALRGIAGSLSEAHTRGLVHRDIKPANVMLCRRGGEDDVVKVLDFGLVKDTRSPHTRDLTRALRVLGTPAYMAPERIERPDSADARSDLYALGAVGFYLLAGKAPFDGDSDLALAYRVVHTPAPRASSAAPEPVPAGLDELIARCLAKSVQQRPATAAEVAAELDRLLAGAPWTNQQARAWWEAHEARRAAGKAGGGSIS